MINKYNSKSFFGNKYNDKNINYISEELCDTFIKNNKYIINDIKIDNK